MEIKPKDQDLRTLPLMTHFLEPGWRIFGAHVPLGKMFILDCNRMAQGTIRNTHTKQERKKVWFVWVEAPAPGWVPAICFKVN